MKFQSIRYVASLFILTSLATSCKGSDSGGTAAAPVPSQEAPTKDGAPAETVRTPSAPVRPDEASSNTTCPNDLTNNAVVENYRAIGVQVEVDCAELRESNFYFQYRASDLDETLKILDRTYELFKNWPNRPAKIVIGERAYHSSAKNLIHVPLLNSRPQDLEDYLHDTCLLMDLEITEFNRKVRFSYVSYDFKRLASGEFVDHGAGGLIGYGIAREAIVEGDIARVRKMKGSILRMPFKNVRLTHANQMGSFLVSAWSDSYTLPTEYTDSQLAPYFKYLTRLASVQKSFGAITLSVIVPSYPTLELNQAIAALDVLAAAKGAIEQTGAKSVQVLDSSLTDMHQRFRISKLNDGLQIHNLYGFDNQTQSAAALKTCLEKADFTSRSHYYCDGHGDLW